jgi:Fur family ferric uptake transcriptional regulator
MNSCKSYSTKQRSVILDKLRDNKDHQYTADELLTTLKSDNTPVGKATLYRYLDHLVQTKEVKKFINDDNVACLYQYVGKHCDEHYHLKCRMCGKLIHLNLKSVSSLNNKIKKNYGFSIETSSVVLYGMCDECNKEVTNEK